MHLRLQYFIQTSITFDIINIFCLKLVWILTKAAKSLSICHTSWSMFLCCEPPCRKSICNRLPFPSYMRYQLHAVSNAISSFQHPQCPPSCFASYPLVVIQQGHSAGYVSSSCSCTLFSSSGCCIFAQQLSLSRRNFLYLSLLSVFEPYAFCSHKEGTIYQPKCHRNIDRFCWMYVRPFTPWKGYTFQSGSSFVKSSVFILQNYQRLRRRHNPNHWTNHNTTPFSPSSWHSGA
jgi:hypothetical protein